MQKDQIKNFKKSDVKLKIAVVIFLFACITSKVFANHTGIVFVDGNKNGKHDKGEKLLRGVLVSDGLHVVKTDKNGLFTLKGHDRQKFIFITTPSGYKTNNAHYIKIEIEKASYNFGLQPNTVANFKGGKHNFIQLSDTEIFNTKGHEDWVSNLRNYAAAERSAFIMHTGDICYENGLKEHIKLMNTENMNCPVFYAIGNHDLVKGKYGEELFESLYGPVFYSFEAGNVHYIVTPMLSGDYKPQYTKEDVYRWMKNNLAQLPKGKPVMIFSHDALTSSDKFIYGISDRDFIDLNERNFKAWMHGHWHINFMRKQGKAFNISTAALDKGGIDHSTSAYRVMHVDADGNFKSELRYTYIDRSIQINSISQNKIPVLANGKIPISVNVYSSNAPAKSVTCNFIIDGKKSVKEVFLQKNTDWNWLTELLLPNKYLGKLIKVQVTATFSNGQIAEAVDTFTYDSAPKQAIQIKSDWTNLLGNPQHIGIAGDSLSDRLSLSWIKNVGANIFMSSPLVYQNKIYTASVDENLKGEAHIYALDAINGSLLWKYKVRNSVKNSIAAGDGKILAQDVEGYLYAVDAITGKLIWDKKLNVNGLPALIEGIVVSGNIVYAGTGKGLCATDLNSGNTLWTNTGWSQREGATTTLALGNGVLVAGVQWGALYGNDAATGRMLWSNNQNGLSDRGASAAIHGNYLYIISRASLFVLDVHTGKVIVRKDLPVKTDVTSTPLVTNNEIILGTTDAGLIALHKETLEMKWQHRTNPALIYTSPYTRHPVATIETSPVSSGSTVFIGASDGVLYGIDKETGKEVWKHQTGSPIFSTVAISGNSLFASDFAGNVYGFTNDLK